MGDVAAEIAKDLDCIKSVLGSIRTPPIPDISESLGAWCAAPLLEDSHLSLLASLEILLLAECQRRDPSRLADSFIAWASTSARNVDPSVVGFVSQTKQVTDFSPEKLKFMSPRSLLRLSDWMESLEKAGSKDKLLRVTVCATIGEQAGSQFLAYHSEYVSKIVRPSTRASGRPSSTADYWSRDPIAPGVLDMALELKILSQEDRAILLEQESWHAPDVDAARLVEKVETLVNAAESILLHCTVASASRELPTGTDEVPFPPLLAERLDPEVGSNQLRASLEETFGFPVESEKEGTLGKILIFRTDGSPERFAVKTIDPSRFKGSSSVEPLQRFSHEIAHWIRYRHNPLILAPFFTALVHGWPYVAMPYCECTLRDYINGSVHKQSQTEPIALMIQAVAALEYAAQLGLVAHQDLKPENILLQDLPKRFCLPSDYPFKWRTRLADFGLANAYRELGLPQGSRPYLAPEQYDKDVAIDYSKVDVFACGVMLHELLTGRHPIGEVTSDVWPEPKAGKPKAWGHEDKWKKWARSPQKPPATAAGDLRNFSDIIERTLRVDPAARPSLAELRYSLLKELKQTDIRSHEKLVVLLMYFHLTAVHSSVLDDDDARYRKKQIETLRKPS